uniref:Uncharacterized protein n=1 Tax=Moniliophthora roreri TaxID=221103 RepID=A0A0W0FFR8_MONRR
MITVPWNFI